MCIPDHPIIRNCEETGFPDRNEPETPICPVCGAEADTFYKQDTEIVGCDECIKAVDAREEV